MKPGTIRAGPFSIQTPTNIITQAMLRVVKLWRSFGVSMMTKAVTLRRMAIQITGTRPSWPWSPWKRYSWGDRCIVWP